LSASDVGNYDVVVNSPYTSVTSAVVAVTVVSPPQNFEATLEGSQAVRLQLNGTPGYSYAVFFATSFSANANWQPLFTNAAGGDGNWSFIDTDTVAGAARFYRAALLWRNNLSAHGQ
jgi:hypothetical protein